MVEITTIGDLRSWNPMEQLQEDNVYDSGGADKTPSELFTGRVPLVDALSKLRARLLDLSARNRLLNYRHPKRRSIQFVDEPIGLISAKECEKFPDCRPKRKSIRRKMS